MIVQRVDDLIAASVSQGRFGVRLHIDNQFREIFEAHADYDGQRHTYKDVPTLFRDMPYPETIHYVDGF